MEFEHNTPTRPEDIARAAAPRVMLQPLNTIQPDVSHGPGMIDTATRRTFDFEKETTTMPTTTTHTSAAHKMAIGFGVAIAVLFTATLAGLAAFR